MQDGVLAGGVPEWTVTVRVGNTVRVAESVSIDAELPSDMPDAVGGVTGVSARTGEIVWAEQQPVQERPVSPWTRASSWPPVPGASVGIWVGDEGTSWKVFTGVIDNTTGDQTRMTSKIIDASDRLNRKVSIPAIAHTMPGSYDDETGHSFANAPTHVQPWNAAYRCLRAGGFGVAAPVQRGGWTVLDVDMQGSIWPTTGTLRHTTSSASTSMAWGEGFTYLSAGSVNYASGTGQELSAGRALRVWGRRIAQGAGTTTITTVLSDGKQIRTRGTLNATMTTFTITVEVFQGEPSNGDLRGSGTATAPAYVQDGSVWFEVAFRPGSGTVTYTVPATDVPAGTANGDASATFALGTAIPTGVTVSNVGVGSGSVAARVGILSSWSQWTSMSSHVSSSKVRAWGRGLVRSQHTSRAIEGRSAKNVLDEIGAATLTSMWIDETGVMQWAPSNVLYAGTRVKTVTTAQDIFSLGWVESMLSTRHKITVNYLEGALTLSRRYGVTLFQPVSGVTVENGTSNEDFLDIPSDEEWLGVDTSFDRVYSDSLAVFGQGHRSYFGGVFESEEETQRWVEQGLTCSLEALGLRTWKLTHTNSRPDGKDVELITKDEDAEPELKKRWRNEPLPIVRGRGKTTFADAAYTSDTTGPADAPDLDFEMASWGRKADATRVADWLAERLTISLITLTNLEVAYDPRLQLGDVITVDSRVFLGFSVDCLIIGKSEQHGNGSFMSLTVRVVRVRSTAVTYAHFEANYSGQDYAALESAWAGATYSQLEANPLGEA